MGVPGFFTWLSRKNKVIIVDDVQDVAKIDITTAYFDYNGVMHPQFFATMAQNIDQKNPRKLEMKVIEHIIEYTNYVIKYIGPSQHVYIAVDGVAPLAKIRQQRQRRFGYANDYRKEIMKKFGVKYNDTMSNIVITPGTNFMDKIDRNLKKYYSNKANKVHYCNEDNQNLEVIYSSYHVPGEGEHKIIQDIKTRYSDNSDVNVGIVGLDADLIFLTMGLKRRLENVHLYLIREADQFRTKKPTEGVEEKLILVDMDATMESINELFREMITDKMGEREPYDASGDEDGEDDGNSDDDSNTSFVSGDIITSDATDMNGYAEKIDRIDFIQDYILINFLQGNDFLPHFYSVDIRRKGLEIVMHKYAEAICDNNLETIIHDKDGKYVINNKTFMKFMQNIAADEYGFFVHRLRKFMRDEKRRTFCRDSERWKVEIWKKEHLVGERIIDKMKLGVGEEEEWKHRYYTHIGGEFGNTQEYKDELCQNYLDGMVWAMRYYFEECPDWRWQYNYVYPPLISDLYDYIERKHSEKSFDMNAIEFADEGNLPMFTQLVSVLPPKFRYLLPMRYRDLMSYDSPIVDMYPIRYEIDKTYKSMLYKCLPLIPTLNINRVLKATKSLKLSKDEARRGKIEPEPITLI